MSAAEPGRPLAAGEGRPIAVGEANRPVTAAETKPLFADLATSRALILAVSGGPDSTALLLLAARWRSRLRQGPALTAVTIDHGLRPEAAAEAAAVKRLARRLGVAHRTLRWRGQKPATGLQQAAREARYRLLAEAAIEAGARHVLTAHTLDDQAETVLFRLARGSGLSGLTGMSRTAVLPIERRTAVLPIERRTAVLPIERRTAPLPVEGERRIMLVRPLLDLPKARLIATCEAAGLAFAADPSNADPRYARTRLRALLPALEEEGLGARRLVQLAARLRRADAALEAAVARACKDTSIRPWPPAGPIELDARDVGRLPAEIRLRLIRRAVTKRAQEGTVELAKVEALAAALDSAMARGEDLRRTLAGALISLADDRLVIESAPPRGKLVRPNKALTTPGGPRRGLRKRR